MIQVIKIHQNIHEKIILRQKGETQNRNHKESANQVFIPGFKCEKSPTQSSAGCLTEIPFSPQKSRLETNHKTVPNGTLVNTGQDSNNSKCEPNPSKARFWKLIR